MRHQRGHSAGQPRSRTSSPGRLNGKSKPPIQGPGRARNASNAAKVYQVLDPSTVGVLLKSQTATVIGFARRGAQVKSTP